MKPVFTKTNPNKRCIYCKGREITDIFANGKMENNLIPAGDGYRCKDIKECEANLMAENTFTDVYVDESTGDFKMVVKQYGKPLIEITEQVKHNV